MSGDRLFSNGGEGKAFDGGERLTHQSQCEADSQVVSLAATVVAGI